ncbi:hypothetical protein HNQ68_003363 [Pseudochrobactrum saccharolyticum]|uniref:Uncharacterized protein n=1 Tax=Pseudochrobactrum saccharolyticum TaxID=354352 RepID=A0A7W8AP69_9HYPH|nr:hypothetical protein [Pseudochrobactrum saccharolyticum]KAB0539856.1 hypothetical protein F7P81_00070 [Pseudochrobactrum saccharolyticum]MBB5092800.1 hypothetical protein [Pseudochrobactrum saccharolyticum]
MRYPFCTDLSDKALGITLFQDFECEVDVSLIWDNGEPVLEVNAVYVDGANLSRGEGVSMNLASKLAGLAESNDALLTRVIEDSETPLRRAA